MKKITLVIFTLLFVIGSYLSTSASAISAATATADRDCVRRCRAVHRDALRLCNNFHGEAKARCIREANERLENCLRNCRN